MSKLDDAMRLEREASPAPWTDSHPGHDDDKNAIRSEDGGVLHPTSYGGEPGLDVCDDDMALILTMRNRNAAMLRLWAAAKKRAECGHDEQCTQSPRNEAGKCACGQDEIEDALAELER